MGIHSLYIYIYFLYHIKSYYKKETRKERKKNNKYIIHYTQNPSTPARRIAREGDFLTATTLLSSSDRVEEHVLAGRGMMETEVLGEETKGWVIVGGE